MPIRDPWSQARTLADLGNLTARWLESGIAWHPGHGPLDDETRALVPVLVRLNRAGFVTFESQPGDTGHDGVQRAAVSMFTDHDGLDQLDALVRTRPGLLIVAHQVAPRWRLQPTGGVPVTLYRDRVASDFGVQLRGSDIRAIYTGVGRGAVRAAIDAWHVTIIDSVWGRPDVLWPALESLLP